MKALLIVLMVFFMAGCTSKTPYGDCVGVNQDKDPTKKYELSVWNTVMAVVFVETIVVPIVVIANQHSCPVGNK